uniref:Uncharacterized protein n=1 Tax=Anopheles albimanus TaxID=7167 RepID=A0A182FX64_ANOAL
MVMTSGSLPGVIERFKQRKRPTGQGCGLHFGAISEISKRTSERAL